MIGYSKDKMTNLVEILDELKFSYVPNDMVTSATFYSVIVGSTEGRQYDREVFSFLFVHYMASKRNSVKFATSSFLEIFEKDVVHSLNRGLFDQRQRKHMLMQPGLVPVVVSDSLQRIGKNDYIGAICNLAIYHDKDIEDMLLDEDGLRKMIQDKQVFKSKFTDFGEVKYGADNIWSK